jgi:very-short-patch-repair endonuclease
MSTPRIPVPFDTVFTTADLPSVGVSRGALQGWRARGEVLELNPGVFVPAPVSDVQTLRKIYASRLTALGTRPLTVEGAALFHGLPLPSVPKPDWSRTPGGIPERFLDCQMGLLVPTLAWTAFNVARSQPVPEALIPLDAALRSGVTVESLRALSDEYGGRRGTRHLAKAIELADANSESPLESKSRGIMALAKIPSPTLQAQVATGQGKFRVDFLWKESRVIGEADGRVKYDDTSAIWHEKRRQVAIERTGFRVIRWGWSDVTTDVQAWLRQLRKALGVGAGAVRQVTTR